MGVRPPKPNLNPSQSTQKQQHLVWGPAGPNTTEGGDGRPPRLDTSVIATHHTRVYRSTALHDFIASTLEHPNLPIATPKVSFIATPIFQH